jgi:hypothetical protein
MNFQPFQAYHLRLDFDCTINIEQRLQPLNRRDPSTPPDGIPNVDAYTACRVRMRLLKARLCWYSLSLRRQLDDRVKDLACLRSRQMWCE